jgi:hypothetical protein
MRSPSACAQNPHSFVSNDANGAGGVISDP